MSEYRFIVGCDPKSTGLALVGRPQQGCRGLWVQRRWQDLANRDLEDR